MPEPAPTAVALARLRAVGTLPCPNGGSFAAWKAAADRAGRRLADVSRPGGPARLALGWDEGAEPVAGPDTGVDRAAPTPVLALTFAALLRACWPDRSDHPYPGVLTTEARVLAGVATLGPLTRGANAAGEGSVRHQKGALRRLTEAGWAEIDGPYLRLGPQVALWSEAQVAALRVSYDRLPAALDDWMDPTGGLDDTEDGEE